jgi:hypothetical protein
MSRIRLPLLLLPAAALLLAARAPHAAGREAREVRWKKTILDRQFRAEGAAAADVNRDGKVDVIAGSFWYEAPDWTPHEITEVKEHNAATGYSDCFLTWAYDVNRDGWPDQLVVGFPGAPAYWYENPGKSGGRWAQHAITDSACNETPHFADVNGDGKPDLLTPHNESQMAYYELCAKPKAGFAQHLIGQPKLPGTERFAHGLGVGDVNGDHCPDILTTRGYYEAPADPRMEPWQFVPANFGPACANMYTHDFDGDGDMDVISSSAHAIGVWWWEQTQGSNGPEFKQHVIDNSFSQSHSMMMVDLNGDRQPDFVTGKRWWAHGPNGDVNPNDPAVLVWYEFRRNGSEVTWIRHQIDDDSGVGTQFTVADVNRDRRPDLVIANKKGVFLFEQVK